ncbi:MAG: glutathione peroxidase [Bryobacteraceae bacterium]|nr:glutathione peroxidase [Bryobacteraceae bacterium]
MLFGASSVHEFTLNSIDGRPTPLAEYTGKTALLVNVASKCGYTPQYQGLEALYKKYKDQGFVVLGFPANNFGAQEPGTNEEIKSFCTRTYNVTFPMFAKISVKGDDQAPLYQFLTDSQANPATGGDVKWNFTKFLVDGNGKVVARFESKVTPESPELVEAIEKTLAK